VKSGEHLMQKFRRSVKVGSAGAAQ